MKTLALMRVTNGGNMLNHSPLSIWLEKNTSDGIPSGIH